MEMNWIPCSERLPETEGLYLTTNVYSPSVKHVLVRQYDVIQECWMTAQNVEITAWMPLPELYLEENKATTSSNVNHPLHYNIAGRKECIVEMQEIFGVEKTKAFCELNAYKYRYRAGLKDDAKTDLAKADWYENYAANLEDMNNDKN